MGRQFFWEWVGWLRLLVFKVSIEQKEQEYVEKNVAYNVYDGSVSCCQNFLGYGTVSAKQV